MKTIRPERNGLPAPHRWFISATEERAEWNQMVLTFGPKADMAQKAFDRNLAGIAAKREVPVEQLASIKTWFELIEHDEGRM